MDIYTFKNNLHAIDKNRTKNVRNNLKYGIHCAPPEKYLKALQSTRIYTILAICKDMIDKGETFEIAMDYCSERVINEGLVKHYISYVLNNHYCFGLGKHGPLIGNKIIAKFLMLEDVYDGFYLTDLESVLVINKDSEHIKRTLNYLKLKKPNCTLLGGMDTPGKINVEMLKIEIMFANVPRKVRSDQCRIEVLSACDIPTMKSLGGFRG